MKTRIYRAPIPEAHSSDCADGFTLLEILLALLVAGLILGVSGPALITILRSDAKACAQVESGLVLGTVVAHEWAGRPLDTGVTLALDESVWQLTRDVVLPTGITLRVHSPRWSVAAMAFVRE